MVGRGWRRFLHGTLGPVAALVGAELQRIALLGSVREPVSQGRAFRSGVTRPGRTPPGRGLRCRVGGIVGVPGASRQKP